MLMSEVFCAGLGFVLIGAVIGAVGCCIGWLVTGVVASYFIAKE